MTFQRVDIEARLCVMLCPPAALGLHMMSLCLSFSAFFLTSSCQFLSLFLSLAVFFSLIFFFLLLQMQGVATVDSDSEQKFIEGTLAEAPSPAPTEPQTPMDVDKASIYR